MNNYRLALLGLLVLLVVGCASQDIPDPEPTADSSSTDSGSDSADTGGFDDEGLGDGEFFAEDELTMVIYFDFDQSELRAEYSDLVARHASNLANNSMASVRLEGHTDERGSREYNIGLGERRAQAVRRILLIQGASANQLSTVSFGEERPAAFGSDEESHSLNRRVELKYSE
jgi:peptidoglycan-associated lipoprotein